MGEMEHSPIRLTTIGTKGMTEELMHTHASFGVQLPQDTQSTAQDGSFAASAQEGLPALSSTGTGLKLAVTPMLASGTNTDNSAPQDCSKHTGLGRQVTGDIRAEYLVYSQGDQRPGSRLQALPQERQYTRALNSPPSVHSTSLGCFFLHLTGIPILFFCPSVRKYMNTTSL